MVGEFSMGKKLSIKDITYVSGYVNRILLLARKKIFNPLGISDIEGTYLVSLSGEKNGLKMTQLTSVLGNDKSCTSRSVASLIKKGLIEKNPNDTLPKKYRLILTGKGAKIVADLNSAFLTVDSITSKTLDKDEYVHLISLIKKIANKEE